MKTINVTVKFVRVLVAELFLINTSFVGMPLAVEPVSNDGSAPVPTISLEGAALQGTTSSSGTPTTNNLGSTQWTPWTTPLSPVTDESQPIGISTTLGRSFYVSKTGSDDTNGSESNPWRSLQLAVSKLEAGDTLYIMEGIYEESADLVSSGHQDAYITIQGIGNVVFDGSKMSTYDAAFDTKGHDYLRFKNLTVKNARAAVEVNLGSNYVEIDGIRTDGNRFAVRINGSSNVKIRNTYAINSNNAFRAYGGSRNLLFENIETYASKDIYVGMNPNYRNGDGFIFERDVFNVTLRNIISGNHWDAGFDIKANDVFVENVIAFGNKNNFKTWGNNITIKSSLSHHALKQLRPDGSTVEGNGITVESGYTRVVNVTLADNENRGVRVYSLGTLRMENSIVAGRPGSQDYLFTNDGGVFSSDRVLWYETGKTRPSFTIFSTDLWADPQFVDWDRQNYRLKSGSVAIDYARAGTGLSKYDLDGNERVVGDRADLGAYEYQGGQTDTQPAPSSGPLPNEEPAPAPAPDPVPTPEPTPVPGPGSIPDSVPTPEPVSEPTPTPSSEPVSLDLNGLAEGQTVSGLIFVQPNQEIIPSLRRVTYYLNGKKAGRAKNAPFTLGGKKGFNTAKLENGKYVLLATYRTAQGEQQFSVSFDILNAG